MADLAHEWGSDVGLSSTNDLLLVSGSEQGRQRVLRRLLTNPGDYVWNLPYGAGLPRQVGETRDVLALEANVREQLFTEVVVALDPAPVVVVSSIFSGAIINVTYQDADTGETVGVGFTVER